MPFSSNNASRGPVPQGPATTICAARWGADTVPKMAALAALFPDRELALRRLHAQDADFRGICDDYEEALTALRYWQGKKDAARAEEYPQMAEELEVEILAALDCPRACRPHPDDG